MTSKLIYPLQPLIITLIITCLHQTYLLSFFLSILEDNGLFWVPGLQVVVFVSVSYLVLHISSLPGQLKNFGQILVLHGLAMYLMSILGLCGSS